MMKTTSQAEVLTQAKRLCDDLEEVVNGTTEFSRYNKSAAERELRCLRREYILLTGTARGFPTALNTLA